MTHDPAGEERVLRAKYLDWCSARVADHFLRLSPDEIYELAYGPTDDSAGRPTDPAYVETPYPDREAAGSPPTSAAASYGDAMKESAGYLALVRRAAAVLASRLELPSFESWVVEYRRAPAPFDEELLGLWKSREGAGRGG